MIKLYPKLNTLLLRGDYIPYCRDIVASFFGVWIRPPPFQLNFENLVD